MRLYLVRHSKAEPVHPLGDEARPLSAKGRQRLEDLASDPKSWDWSPGTWVSSPYLRARQTAEGLARHLGLSQAASVLPLWPSLEPEAEPSEVLESLTEWYDTDGPGDLWLFTHNPLVTRLAYRLVRSADRGHLGKGFEFHTPSCLALEFEAAPCEDGGRWLWVQHPRDFL